MDEQIYENVALSKESKTEYRYRSWLHQNTTTSKAEEKLQNFGIDGSFLVSHTTRSGYVLSIRSRGEIYNVKIHHDKHCFKLGDNEKFDTIDAAVQYILENQPGEKNGQLFTVKHPVYAPPSFHQRWFHGHISGKDADQLLREKGRNGSYLVRESQSKPGDFVLSVRTNPSQIEHLVIKHENMVYKIDNLSFPKLPDLLKHLSDKVHTLTNNKKVKIKKPLNTTRFSPWDVDQRLKILRKSNGIYKEFDVLATKHKQEDTKKDNTCREALRPENKVYNRYRNIVPFDSSRVKLQGTQRYINANHIEAQYELGLKYIAMQGCLANTVVDVWRMVAQEKSNIIVMVTKLIEAGKNKCYKYWPEPNQTLEFTEEKAHGQRIKVHCEKEKASRDYTIREFALESGAERRKVFQYHFTAWPDKDVPTKAEGLLEFIHEIQKLRENLDSSPVVVHCSAGIGRTGTYIVLDMLIAEMKLKGAHLDSIDVQETVAHVRTQRLGMVQTQTQYGFIYEALKEYVEAGTQGRPATQILQATEESPEGALYSNINDIQARGGIAAKRSGPPPAPLTPKPTLQLQSEDGTTVYANVKLPLAPKRTTSSNGKS